MKVVSWGLFYLSNLFAFILSVLIFGFFETFLLTTFLIFLEVLRTLVTLLTSKLSTFVIKLFKLVGKLIYLATFSLSTSAFKVIKTCLAAKSDVLTSVGCFNSF